MHFSSYKDDKFYSSGITQSGAVLLLNNALVFLLMLVIWSVGRQEYKLQLRLPFSD